MYAEATGKYLFLRALEHSEFLRVAFAPLSVYGVVEGSSPFRLLGGSAFVRLALLAAWERRMARRKKQAGRIIDGPGRIIVKGAKSHACRLCIKATGE